MKICQFRAEKERKLGTGAHTVHTKLILIPHPAHVHIGTVGHPDATDMEASCLLQQLIPHGFVQLLHPKFEYMRRGIMLWKRSPLVDQLHERR